MFPDFSYAEPSKFPIREFIEPPGLLVWLLIWPLLVDVTQKRFLKKSESHYERGHSKVSYVENQSEFRILSPGETHQGPSKPLETQFELLKMI